MTDEELKKIPKWVWKLVVAFDDWAKTNLELVHKCILEVTKREVDNFEKLKSKADDDYPDELRKLEKKLSQTKKYLHLCPEEHIRTKIKVKRLRHKQDYGSKLQESSEEFEEDLAEKVTSLASLHDSLSREDNAVIKSRKIKAIAPVMSLKERIYFDASSPLDDLHIHIVTHKKSGESGLEKSLKDVVNNYVNTGKREKLPKTDKIKTSSKTVKSKHYVWVPKAESLVFVVLRQKSANESNQRVTKNWVAGKVRVSASSITRYFTSYYKNHNRLSTLETLIGLCQEHDLKARCANTKNPTVSKGYKGKEGYQK